MFLSAPCGRARSASCVSVGCSCLRFPLLVAGCSTWATSPPPVRPVVEDHEGDHVQVKVEGLARFDLHEIQIVGDSLIGTTGAGGRHAVAVDDVEYLRVQPLSA